MAMTDEERALRDADKAYKRRVRDAEKTLEAAQEGQLITSYRTTKVYSDRIVDGNEQLELAPETRAEVHASGAITAGKDGKKIDSRELYLQVENVNGGMTIKCKPDHGEQVRQLAQKIRLAGPGAAQARIDRKAAAEQAAAALEKTRADRSEVEAAEAALPADAIDRVRRRQRYAWVKWAVGGLAAVVALIAILGGGNSSTNNDTAGETGTPVAPPPPSVEQSARLQLDRSATWCKQDLIVGDVDFVVALKNTGDQDADDVAVLPIRQYASGREVRPIGDTLVDITVPADGKLHRSNAHFGVGAGEQIDGCQIKVISDDYRRSGEEIDIAVRSDAPAASAESSVPGASTESSVPDAPAPSAEPPAAECDSNYSGCVPVYPPDVNCPSVAGPVQVTGTDVHGLDRDGDGSACE